MKKEYQKERSHENFKRSNDCDYIVLMFDDIAKSVEICGKFKNKYKIFHSV